MTLYNTNRLNINIVYTLVCTPVKRLGYILRIISSVHESVLQTSGKYAPLFHRCGYMYMCIDVTYIYRSLQPTFQLMCSMYLLR